jgi:hypothetical protein
VQHHPPRTQPAAGQLGLTVQLRWADNGKLGWLTVSNRSGIGHLAPDDELALILAEAEIGDVLVIASHDKRLAAATITHKWTVEAER